MNNELMLRLLKEDKDSPSGFRIVGYEKKDFENHRYIITSMSYDMELWFWKSDEMGRWIHYDAFEQGIKMPDGTWWFEGDKIEFDCFGKVDRMVGVLIWDSYEMIIEAEQNYYNLWQILKRNPKRIGTIHEEMK